MTRISMRFKIGMFVLLAFSSLILAYFNYSTYNDKIAMERKVKQCHVVKNKCKVIEYGFYDILNCLDKKKGYSIKSISNVDTNNICCIEVEYYGNLTDITDKIQSISEYKNFIALVNVDIVKYDKEKFKSILCVKFLKNK
ncbi:hypothetical protein CLTEP_00740 [Clostridium tepidiprofundi DSM 19306]|uniref:Uncharacterized protein n=1 Tax=Clostridium tepidiprofundi DSM 19306 TaxID=1121338 RepID=A0A151B6W8_9CLOT|nr:hypothetical protein [Clostridium tepidiprofundi]KYH35681.1 hypothetical protein CLTEP_00740 [Clostridium tepidiprofundi DSM 19306]